MDKKNKKHNIIKIYNILFAIFFSISILLVFSTRWLIAAWAGVTIEEVLYHLSVSMEGANLDEVYVYIFQYLFPSLGIILLVTVIYFLAIKFFSKRFPKKQYFPNVILVAGTGACFLYAFFLIKIDTDFLEIRSSSDFIEENYVNASNVNLTFPEKKRNLIYIYLESMETTYSDKKNGGALENNIIPNLTRLSEENIDFSKNANEINGGYVLSGTTWTMGAMFGQSTGLPLKTTLAYANDLDTQNSLFPGVQSIGDILENNGYNNILLIGSTAAFGGREVFYRTHGNYEIHDFNYAKDINYLDEDYYVFWGYEDSKLFEYAKKEITELANEDKPFNYTILTVDTHASSGYFCELCENEEELQYANVIKCSDRQVSSFINWIKEQDFYDNTTIVLSGDHTTMSHDLDKLIDKSYDRKTFLTIINPNVSADYIEKFRKYSTFDLFPTTLASLGVKIEGDRLGLGVNLFSKEQTLVEKYGAKFCDKEIYKKSDFMESLNELELTEEYGSRIKAETTVVIEDTLNDNEKKIIAELDYDYLLTPDDQLIVYIWTYNEENGELTPKEYYLEDKKKEGEGKVLVSGYINDENIICMNLFYERKGVKRFLLFHEDYKASFEEDLNKYLDLLYDLDKERYLIIISAMDEASSGIDERIDNKLKRMGLQETLINRYRDSYAAILVGNEITEKIDSQRVSIAGKIEGDISYRVESAGFLVGNDSIIEIDGFDYSKKQRGLNFVIYDYKLKACVNSCNFDTYFASDMLSEE